MSTNDNEFDDDNENLDPRGQHRDDVWISRRGPPGWHTARSIDRRARSSRRDDDELDIQRPPEHADEDFRSYYLEFPFVQAALTIFNELVVEPGWEVEARDPDSEEVDEDMTEALRLWGENCVIHAGEPGHDLTHLLTQCPTLRRVKPAVFIEKIGTTSDPDAIAALQLLEPTSITIYLRKDQNLVVQPGDDLPVRHHETPDGRPAAYVQYDEELRGSRFSDSEPIPFAADDLVKLVYDPPEGSAWGRTIFPAIEDAIVGLKTKLADRNAAIRLAGYPHRIYSSDEWTKQQAKDFADSHDNTDEFSDWDLEDERISQGFASRTDFVPTSLEVQVITGEVADIQDAVMDDIQAIFSMMPVSRFKIAYEESINQFVVEPQERKDALWIDKERRYLESKFGPLFEQKADQLANGAYDGEVTFRVRQPVADNPLERESFDPERFADFVGAFTDWASSDASVDYPRSLPYFAAGMDMEQFEEEHGLPEIEEDDEDEPIPPDQEPPDQPPPGADETESEDDEESDSESDEDETENEEGDEE